MKSSFFKRESTFFNRKPSFGADLRGLAGRAARRAALLRRVAGRGEAGLRPLNLIGKDPPDK